MLSAFAAIKTEYNSGDKYDEQEEKPKSSTDCVEMALDEASYINHGETPDLINTDITATTLRKMNKGDKILQDYNEFIASERISLDWWD
jgi:hypothetical protein